MDTTSIVIDPPVKGEWAVFNPPGHPKQAFDLLAVNKDKSPYRQGGLIRHMFSFISVENTFTWTAPVYSPVAGGVVEVVNTENDRLSISMIHDLLRLLIRKPDVKKGFGAFGGNYVLINCVQFYVLLCHLKEGSVCVKPGDSVSPGQQVAEVGNSGSSIQPHLHIQVMKNSNIFPLFQNLLPFKISRAKEKNGKNIGDIQEFSLANTSHYIFDWNTSHDPGK